MPHETANTLMQAIFCVVLFMFGMVGLRSPAFVQRLALKMLNLDRASNQGWRRKYVSDAAYLTHVRACAILSLLMAGGMLAVIIHNNL